MKVQLDGVWTVQGGTQIDLYGTLTYSYDASSELKIIGSFSDDEMLKIDTPVIINGFSVNGKRITLIDCHLSNHIYHAPGMEQISWYVNKVVIGESSTDIEGRLFKKIRMHFENIEEWLDLQLIKISNNFEEQSICFEYTLPHEIVFIIDKQTRLRIVHSSTSPGGRSANNIKFTSSAYLVFESEPGISLDDISLIVHKLKILLTLFTMKSFNADCVELLSPQKGVRPDGVEYDIWLKYFYHQVYEFKYSVSVDDDKYPSLKYLTTFPILQPFFERILTNWFEKYEVLSPILETIYINYYLPQTTIESSFLQAVQAFESFHRRLRKNEKIPKQDFKAQRNEILAQVDAKYKSWLSERLAFAYEPSLKERLIEHFSEADSIGFKELIDEQPRLIESIRDTRNYYTHFDLSLEKKALSYNDMIKVTKLINMFMNFLLFKEIGIDEATAKKIFQKGRLKNIIVL